MDPGTGRFEEWRCRRWHRVLRAQEVDESAFEWRRGDVFAVPAWREHRIRTRGRSHLLRVSDEPVLAGLDWLREEKPRAVSVQQMHGAQRGDQR
jgi:hypothetical protein